jgi:hypothetical protein
MSSGGVATQLKSPPMMVFGVRSGGSAISSAMRVLFLLSGVGVEVDGGEPRNVSHNLNFDCDESAF